MPKEFRVVDCRTNVIERAEFRIMADTPEQAARLAIGEDLMRGSARSGPLRARVYVQSPGGLTLVRLYARASGPEGPEPERKPTDRWGD